jgi:hypothetical protein
VHCVIVGFGLTDRAGKVIYEYDDIKGDPHAVPAQRINPYLVDAPDVVLRRYDNLICDVPEILQRQQPSGRRPLDLFTHESKQELPHAMNQVQRVWLRRWLGAEGFLNNEALVPLAGRLPPSELRAMPLRPCTGARRTSDALASTKAAHAKAGGNACTLSPKTANLTRPLPGLPRTSSENRRFMPLGY